MNNDKFQTEQWRIFMQHHADINIAYNDPGLPGDSKRALDVAFQQLVNDVHDYLGYTFYL